MVALITHVAVAGRPLPVPIIVQPGAAQRRDGQRTEPQIVVDVLGHGLRTMRLADRLAPFVTERASRHDLADVARALPGDGLSDRWARAVLHARLHDATVLLGGQHE